MTTPRKRPGRAAAKAVAPQPEPTTTAELALPPTLYPLSVHVLWAQVMEGVRSIAKGDYNEDQGFSFRGVDSVVDAVGPALRRAGIFVVPHRVREHSATEYVTKRGTRMVNRVVRVQWRVYGPRGDWFPGESMGEAADSGDKSLSKAQSVAYRVYLLQALNVPTGERDPDADSHERASAATGVVDRNEYAQAQAGEENQAAQPDNAEARSEMWRVAKGLGWQWKALADRFKTDHGMESTAADADAINAFTALIVGEAQQEEDRAKQTAAEVLGAKPIGDEAQAGEGGHF